MEEQQQTVPHWSDTVAEEIVRNRKAESYIVATGITPSGPIHLGNMREVLTGDALYKAILKQGKNARLIYIADTFDPLRKVYPFLPEEFSKYIGMPLFEIPDPEGDCHKSYADHFLEPFLQALSELGIHLEVLKAHELYKNGKFAEVSTMALSSRDKIKKILEDVSGRELPDDWWPFQPQCANCKRVSSSKIDSFDESSMEVSYSCDCGFNGKASISKGEGKMPWRIDWPARWKALGVMIEPFGKDHAAAGGSYDTSVKISEEVFNFRPPYPTIYEWIYLKGQGAMASSTGVGISIQQLLTIIRPEIIRYLVLRSKPEKHIDFEPTQGILKIADDYDRLEDSYFDETADNWSKRLYELCQVEDIPQKSKPHIPLGHLAIAIQTGRYKTDEIINVLKRSGCEISSVDIPFVNDLIKKTSKWLEDFAPSGYKFEDPESITPNKNDFTDKQLELIAELAVALEKTDWTPDAIHMTIHTVSTNIELSQKNAFQAVYLALIGQKHGPRAGWFISSISREFIIKRFKTLSS